MSATSARSRLVLAAAAIVCVAAIAAAQSPADVQELLARVGRRVDEYYKRVENIICTERVTAQPVASDLSSDGFARVLEYELHVERDGTADGAPPSDANVVRELKKVNGRTPRPNDKPGCYDPNPLSPEPLAFLLPAHRSEYAFTFAGFGKGKDSRALLIDFRPLERGRPEVLEDSKGRPECFSISLPGATRGRVWIDSETYDVMRVEEHLVSRVDVRVPFKLQTRRGLPDVLVVERYDSFVRYRPVAFQDPEETMLLPESISVLAIMHGAGSHRTQQTFSDYRRFLTRGRVVK